MQKITSQFLWCSFYVTSKTQHKLLWCSSSPQIQFTASWRLKLVIQYDGRKHDNNSFPLRPNDPWMCGGVLPLARQKRSNINAMTILNQVPGGVVFVAIALALLLWHHKPSTSTAQPLILSWLFAKPKSIQAPQMSDVWSFFVGKWLPKNRHCGGHSWNRRRLQQICIGRTLARVPFQRWNLKTTKRQRANIQTIYSMFSLFGR